MAGPPACDALRSFHETRRDPAGASRLSAPETAPLIGRREELGLLLQRFAEAREGHGQVVLVGGEPGIGKTHLAREFARRLTVEGFPPLECWCSPEGASAPLGPFIDLVVRLAAADGAAAGPPTLGGLEALARRASLPAAEIVPLLAELLSLPLVEPWEAPAIPPAAKRRRTLDALVALLVGLAEARPLALIAEDLHWADPSSLELFDLLLAEAGGAPLVAVLTFRPEFEPSWAWRQAVSHVPLGPLERAQCEELIGLAVAGSEVPAAVRQTIAERGGGVPLFLVEIARATIAGAQGGDGDGGATLADIPATLGDSLTARLDRLGSAKAVARQAAALGHSFPQELLVAVSPLSEAALTPELDRLVAAGLLRRSGHGWRSTYEFEHVLLRQLAYGSLPETERRQLHETVFRVLEARFPDLIESQPERAARHAEQAGLADRAVDLWQRAGRRALERSAGAEAVVHLRAALELVAAQPAGGGRDRRELELLNDLGPAVIGARGYGTPEVEEIYLRADALCRQVDEPAQRLEVLKGLHTLYFVQARFGKGLDNARAIRELGARPGLEVAEGHFHETVGAFSWFGGDFAAAHEHFEAAEGLTRERAAAFSTVHELRTIVLAEQSATLGYLGYPDRALERHREAMARARRIGQPFNTLFAMHLGVWVRQLRSEPEAVAAAARELSAAAAELELPYLMADADVLLGWALSCGPPGRVAGDAVSRLRRGIAGLERVGMRMGTTYRLSLLADACIRRGRPDEAGDALAAARAEADSTGELFRSAELHRLAGELALARGGDDAIPDAEAAFRLALDTARGQRAKSLELRAAVSLGRLWRRLGRSDEARELVSSVYEDFTEGAELPDPRAARELLAEL